MSAPGEVGNNARLSVLIGVAVSCLCPRERVTWLSPVVGPEGDWVFIETARGKIKQKAKLTSNIHPQMVEVQHAWWFPEKTAAEPVLYGVFDSNANVLTPDDDRYLDPAVGGASFTPLLCRIYPAKE